MKLSVKHNFTASAALLLNIVLAGCASMPNVDDSAALPQDFQAKIQTLSEYPNVQDVPDNLIEPRSDAEWDQAANRLTRKSDKLDDVTDTPLPSRADIEAERARRRALINAYKINDLNN